MFPQLHTGLFVCKYGTASFSYYSHCFLSDDINYTYINPIMKDKVIFKSYKHIHIITSSLNTNNYSLKRYFKKFMSKNSRMEIVIIMNI